MQNYSKIIGVLEMKINDGRSHRDVIGRYRLSFGALDSILKKYRQLNIPVEELKKMEPGKVEELFYPPKGRKREVPYPEFEKIYFHIHSKEKTTLFNQWLDYKEKNPLGYQYSRFCDLYKAYLKENHYADDLSMAVNRMPGEKIYIDWVGDRPAVLYERDSNSLKKVSLFVTTVGVSSFFFVKAYENEKVDNFIDGTVSALEYYGAVSKYLVPDNCKTAVTKHSKDELIINSAYEDLEKCYDVVVLPPPARKPKGKATVEKCVQFVEERIIPLLRKNVYPSLETLNRELVSIVDRLNDEKKKNEKYSKRETFRLYDLPAMKPLPKSSFVKTDYRIYPKVPNNYHLEYDGHYYSIPYQYYGSPAILKASFKEILLCDEYNRLICKHPRAYNPYPKYITIPDHMPSSHRYYEEINSSSRDDFLKRAEYISPELKKLVCLVMHSFKYEEQSYNSINGILHLCDGVSSVLIKEAAEKCIKENCASYSYFKKFLNRTEIKKEGTALPAHNNIRGKDYYR